MTLPRGLLPDVASAIGCDVADIDAQVIARSVDDGLTEFEQLDWKRLYPANAHGTSEIAKDVAALANGRGGAIIVGVAEKDGRAAELAPVAVGDSEERRIVQAVATGTHPRVDVRVVSIRVAEQPTSGFLLIVVPPSPIAPHAVEDKDRLRYPVRRGTTTAAMREYEVRSAYLRQRDLLNDRRNLAARLATQSIAVLDDEAPVRLAVAVVPDRPGSLEITEELVRELQGHPLPNPTTLHEPGPWNHGQTRTVLGGVRLTWGGDQFDGQPGRFVQYLDDGSLAYGTDLGFPSPTDDGSRRALYDAAGRPMVPQLMVVGHITRAVEVAAEHAARCGTFGTATTVAYMRGSREQPLVTLRGRGSFGGATSDVANPDAEALATTLELPAPDRGALLVAAARRAVQPLLQLHGVADVPVLNADGTVSPYQPNKPELSLEQWARRVDTELTG